MELTQLGSEASIYFSLLHFFFNVSLIPLQTLKIGSFSAGIIYDILEQWHRPKFPDFNNFIASSNFSFQILPSKITFQLLICNIIFHIMFYARKIWELVRQSGITVTHIALFLCHLVIRILN